MRSEGREAGTPPVGKQNTPEHSIEHVRNQLGSLEFGRVSTGGVRGRIEGDSVRMLQRWGSVWTDLLHVDMALHERSETADIPSTVFVRRALWESAVISYGRAGVSMRKRKVPFRDFVLEATGPEGLATHERIMDWRHGHVAHRTRPEFEDVEASVAFYPDGRPSELHLVVSTDIGPATDSPFAVAFANHAKSLRDALYETKILDCIENVVDDLNAERIAPALGAEPDSSTSSRLKIDHCLATFAHEPPETDGSRLR